MPSTLPYNTVRTHAYYLQTEIMFIMQNKNRYNVRNFNHVKNKITTNWSADSR